MFFYKLQGFCAEVTSDNDRQAKRELARKIAFATAEYNALNGDIYFFVSDITDDTVTLGLITKSYVHPTKSAKKYADFIGLNICDIIVDEITIMF